MFPSTNLIPPSLALARSVAAFALGLTVAWLVFRLLRRSSEPLRLSARLLATAILLALAVAILSVRGSADDPTLVVAMAAFGGIALAALWGRSIGEALANPITRLFDGGGREMERRPLYSFAETHIKRGRYAEAEHEIRRQLEQFPNDLTGVLLLGELQAGHLGDLPAAAATLEAFLAQTQRNPGDAAAVLHRLAEWHLHYAQDPDAARAALERVIERFPDGEAAFLARQRLAHLPSPQTLQEKHSPHLLAVPETDQRLGLRDPASVQPPPPENPNATAARLVQRLHQTPDDHEAREDLARLYATEFRRLDLAADQFEQLISQHRAPATAVVRWLNALADAQIHCGGDLEAARATLSRIEQRFPRSAHAEVAMRRRLHLPLELRRQQANRVIAHTPGQASGNTPPTTGPETEP